MFSFAKTPSPESKKKQATKRKATEPLGVVPEVKKRKISDCNGFSCGCEHCSKIQVCSVCKMYLLEDCVVECSTCKEKSVCGYCRDVKHGCVFRPDIKEVGENGHIYSGKGDMCGEHKCQHLMNYIYSPSYETPFSDNDKWLCKKHSKKCVICTSVRDIDDFPKGYTNKVVEEPEFITFNNKKYSRVEYKIVKEPVEYLSINIRGKAYTKTDVCKTCIETKKNTEEEEERDFPFNVLDEEDKHVLR
jgi:hypothetical protein